MRRAYIAAAVILATGAAVVWQRQTGSNEQASAEDWLNDAAAELEAAADNVVSIATGGILKLQRMKTVTPAMLANANVQAMLRVIRRGEGTADEGGYHRLFGGGNFESYADHPRILVKKNGYSSTAAGAYQFLARVWDETRNIMGLPDFSPHSQDMGALGRIAARGALEDVIAGRFDTAVSKIAKEWASLPGSPYGQPTISLATARAAFASAGGTALA